MMLIRIWRLATLMLAALSMGVALCHLLELPAKITYDGATWLMLLQTLYRMFGPIGGAFEIGAVVAALALAFLVRRRRPAFGWTLAAALCLVAAHGAFWIWVAPVNAALVPLAPESLPPDWTRLRDRWEYTHAARALLQVAALAALAWSALVETPADAPRGRPA